MEWIQVTPVTPAKNRRQGGFMRSGNDKHGQRSFANVLDDLAAEPAKRHREDGFDRRQGKPQQEDNKERTDVKPVLPPVVRLDEEQLTMLLSLSV